jgi:uncharacterized protein with NAD-binding domain and iron-sulfur cluster
MSRRVRGYFMKVRYDQQQFQHPVTLLRICAVRMLFEIVDHRQRVRQQPLKITLIQGTPFVATTECVACAKQRLVEKVVEAKLLAHQSGRNRVSTSGPLAIRLKSGIHRLPRKNPAEPVAGPLPEVDTITILLTNM